MNDHAAQLEGEHGPVPLNGRADLVLTTAQPHDKNPVTVYLGRLAPGSRRTMTHALNTIAAELTSAAPIIFCLWIGLGYDTSTRLPCAPPFAEKHAPATVNKRCAGS